MKTPKTQIALSVVAIAAFAAAPAAAATVEAAVVPPSNSAAAQYTETFPTSGGDEKTDQKPAHRSPAKVLGSHNAHKLQEQGPEGRAAAAAAAATAPSAVEPVTTTTTTEPSHRASGASPSGGSGSPNHQDRGKAAVVGIGQATKVGGGAPSSSELPSGSSGIGSAFEHATGLSTSGQSGLLLPLAILATILWSLAYLWRQRRQVG